MTDFSLGAAGPSAIAGLPGIGMVPGSFAPSLFTAIPVDAEAVERRMIEWRAAQEVEAKSKLAAYKQAIEDLQQVTATLVNNYNELIAGKVATADVKPKIAELPTITRALKRVHGVGTDRTTLGQTLFSNIKDDPSWPQPSGAVVADLKMAKQTFDLAVVANDFYVSVHGTDKAGEMKSHQFTDTLYVGSLGEIVNDQGKLTVIPGAWVSMNRRSDYDRSSQFVLYSTELKGGALTFERAASTSKDVHGGFCTADSVHKAVVTTFARALERSNYSADVLDDENDGFIEAMFDTDYDNLPEATMRVFFTDKKPLYLYVLRHNGKVGAIYATYTPEERDDGDVTVVDAAVPSLG